MPVRQRGKGHKALRIRAGLKGERRMLDKIALFLLIVGGLNWGLVGLFEFDLVAFLFGGSTAALSRIVYVLVAVSAIWCISLFFKENELVEAN